MKINSDKRTPEKRIDDYIDAINIFRQRGDLTSMANCAETLVNFVRTGHSLPTVYNNPTIHNKVKEIVKEGHLSTFEGVLDEMQALYKRKNHDYGNSFSKTIEEFGYIPAVARINDKINRLKQLVKGESMQVEEPMRDTLIDIANYCILTILELDKPKE